MVTVTKLPHSGPSESDGPLAVLMIQNERLDEGQAKAFRAVQAEECAGNHSKCTWLREQSSDAQFLELLQNAQICRTPVLQPTEQLGSSGPDCKGAFKFKFK